MGEELRRKEKRNTSAPRRMSDKRDRVLCGPLRKQNDTEVLLKQEEEGGGEGGRGGVEEGATRDEEYEENVVTRTDQKGAAAA